jgi:exopolysaccharide biosynthesis polyprenyl glycosylphosphotransferase
VSEHRLLLTAGDAAVITAGVLVALWLWTLTAGTPMSPRFVRTNAPWLLAIPAWLLCLAPSRGVRTALSLDRTLTALLQAAALLLVAYLTLYFYSGRQALPRLVALYILWEGLLLTLAWRLVYIWLFTQTAFRRRLLILGAGPGAEIVRQMVGTELRDASIVAAVDPTAPPAPPDATSASHDLERILGTEAVSEIVLAPDGPMDPGLVQALLHAQQRGVDLVSMPALYEMVRQRVPVDHLPDDWLIGSLLDTVRSRDASRVLKRAADVAGGLAGLVVYAAAWPIIALAIRLGSPGPIHYSQVRVGQAGHPFRLVKFRTMVPDAEANGPRWANANDPRVTRVGRFLRRTRLDELPQVLNVVRGEMSLVGPRPERPEFVAWLEREIPFYGARLMIRPGLTGWAQVNHPYGESMLDAKAKLEYDLYYIKHRSMLFDLRILFRTVWTILRLKGT